MSVTPCDRPASADGFAHFGLDAAVLRAVVDAGYEQPTPVQSGTIPSLRAGRDVLGQAQTGTGKTAAFALPLLSRLDLSVRAPQVVVLTPTRELALQVEQAFVTYGRYLRGLRAAAIYGGAGMVPQLRQLRAGVHVVVGTPGRLMDHLRRGSLSLDRVCAWVIDEADEMLRMGFADDVQWILERAPQPRQMALFSATMPAAVQRIAGTYLRDPERVIIQATTCAADTIRQRVLEVEGPHKLEALSRVLTVEPIEAALVFVRTKSAAVAVADELQRRGHTCAPLNGDMPQARREEVVALLREGRLKIIVATDVAARGLDVDRISHVINFDIPHDYETYVHRIGRTGRAGRRGEAIVFAGRADGRVVATLRRAARNEVELMEMPRARAINKARVARFKQRITERVAAGGLDVMESVLTRLTEETGLTPMQAAAALAALVQGDEPLLLQDPQPVGTGAEVARRPHRSEPGREAWRAGDNPPRRDAGGRARHAARPQGEPGSDIERGMERFHLDVGRTHGVTPSHIVGAIANVAGLSGRHIGRICIEHHHSTVDLPEGMPAEVLHDLRRVRLGGRLCGIARSAAGHGGARGVARR